MADEFDKNIPQDDELPEGIIELTDEDIYVSVDDDAISQAVFDKFMEMVEEEDE